MPAAPPSPVVEGSAESENLSGLIDLTNREEVKIVDGVASDLWDARRDQRAKTKSLTPERQVQYYKRQSTLERIGAIHHRWISTLYKSPALTVGLSIAVIVVSVGFLYSRVSSGQAAEPTFEVRHAYFYDLSSGKIFVNALSDPPPIAAPGQGEGDEPRGVRAYLYTCGQCSPVEWFVAYLESFDLAIRDEWAKKRTPGDALTDADRAVLDAGRYIAGVPEKEFVPAHKPEAAPLIERAKKACPDGKPPKACEPTEI